MLETESLPVVDEAVAEFLCAHPDGAYALAGLAASVGYPVPAVGDALDRLESLAVVIRGQLGGQEKFTLSARWAAKARAKQAPARTADARDDEPDAEREVAAGRTVLGVPRKILGVPPNG